MVTKDVHMLNTTADEGKRRNRPVCLMIKKNKKNKKTFMFHEEEWKSRCHWVNFDLWMLLCPSGNHLLAALAPECMWISGLDGSSILQKGYRISQKKKIQFLLRDWLLNFLSCSVPAQKQPSAQSELLDSDMPREPSRTEKVWVNTKSNQDQDKTYQRPPKNNF